MNILLTHIPTHARFFVIIAVDIHAGGHGVLPAVPRAEAVTFELTGLANIPLINN